MADDELDNLRELLDQPRLVLPIGDRKFVVTECSGETWLRLQAVAEHASGKAVADDDETIFNTELFQLALGREVFEQIAKHATGGELARAGMTAWYWQTGARALARLYWQSGGKAQASPTSTSSSTDAASTSPTPASGSGTTSRPRSKSAAKRTPTRSRSSRSSATGG